MSDRVCVRKSDGTVWELSFRDDWGDGDAIAAAFSGEVNFYFRQIVPRRVGWWIFKRWVWDRTGEIWEPESGHEFYVADAQELLTENTSGIS